MTKENSFYNRMIQHKQKSRKQNDNGNKRRTTGFASETQPARFGT